MANEATLYIQTGLPISMTCADSALEKGTVLKIADPFTVSASSAAVDQCGGILAREKLVDGKLKCDVFRTGIFKMYLSGSATVGDIAVTDAAPNYVKTGTALSANALSGCRVLGHFLETGTTGETVLVDVNIQSRGGF
jgi:hypothetical protein